MRVVIFREVDQILRGRGLRDFALERPRLVRIFHFLSRSGWNSQPQQPRGASNRDKSSHTVCPFFIELRSCNGEARTEQAIHISLNFGRSWESISPTGSCFALTTMRSSMLRSLKILSASAPSASARMQIGLRVITRASGSVNTLSPDDSRRRKSPSVKTPTNLPL